MAEEIDLGSYLTEHVSTQELPEFKPKTLTYYYPETPEATRAAGLSYKMEGGIRGGPGFSDVDLRNHTLEKFKAGDSPFVAVAMPGPPTGKTFKMIVEGTPIIAKDVDTGGGLHGSHVDIATSNPDLARGGGYGGGAGGGLAPEGIRRPVEPIEFPEKPPEIFSDKKASGTSALAAPTPVPQIKVDAEIRQPFAIPEALPVPTQIANQIPVSDFSGAVQEAVTNPPAASLLAANAPQGAAQDIDLGAYLAQSSAAPQTTTAALSAPAVPSPTPVASPTPDVDLGEYLAQRTSRTEVLPTPIGAPDQSSIMGGAVEGLKEMVPKTVGQAARMVFASPVEETPRAFKQAYDVLSGVPVAQAVPESQAYVGKTKRELSKTITQQTAQLALGAAGLKMSIRAHPTGKAALNPNELTKESGEVIPEHPESAAIAAQGGLLNRIGKALTSFRDVFTIEPLPNLRRAGIRDSGYIHASSRNAVVPMARDLLSRVFPDSYKDPDAMRVTGDILVKDNVLGIYDQLKGMLNKPDISKTLRKKLEANLADMEAKVPLEQYAQDVRKAAGIPEPSAAGAPTTKVAENIKRWKQYVNPEMDAMYTELQGNDPNMTPDPRGRYFGARVNLLPDFKAERLVDFMDHTKAMPEPSYANYRNPEVKRDPFARHAAGTAKYVDDPYAMLLNTLGSRWVETTKIRFYKDIVDSGNGLVTEPGGLGPPGMTRMPVRMPETSENGAVRMVENTLWVKKSIADEVRQVLNVDKLGGGNPLFQWVTGLQLMQAVDITAHMKNIHTVIANSLTGDLGVDAMRRLPFASTIDTVARIGSVIKEIQADTPAIRAEIADMAKRGEIRPKYPSTGIQKITKGQDMIHAADTAARIVMKRFWQNIVQRGRVVDMSDSRRQFVNKIGEYNQRVMNDMMRRVRALGLSPFVVAGRSFNAFSRRLIFGSPGFKPANAGQAILLRSLNMTSLASAAAIPAILNYVITGKPGGRDGVPIGAIDTGKDNSQGKPIVVDLFHLLGIRRGLRATGIGSFVQGLRSGKTGEQIAEDMIGDVVSTALFPWMGPGVQALIGSTTGKRLDFRGGHMYSVGKELKPGEGIQQIENLRGTLKEANPLTYSLIAPIFHLGGYEEPSWQQQEFLPSLGEAATKAPLGSFGIRTLSKKEMGEEDRGSGRVKGFYLGK